MSLHGTHNSTAILEPSTAATFAGQIVAVVPVRSFSGGKTRLAGALSRESRADLIREMLAGVIRAAADSGVLGAVIVVSPDPDVLRFAAQLDPLVHPLPQDANLPGLIPALEQARDWAERHGASGVLIISGDLPLLSPVEVCNLVRRDAPVVIAPDRHGRGTNALMLRLRAGQSRPDVPLDTDEQSGPVFRFQFGPGSYVLHRAEAERLGFDVATANMPGTALDLDTPADLDEMEQRTATFAAD